MFSSRLAADLTPGRLQRALEALRADRVPLLDLTVSNPPACGLGPEADLLARALATPQAAVYQPDPRGLLSTRQAVAGYCTRRGLPTEPESLFLCASTSQAYSELIKLFADPGDEILIPRPSYPLFEMLVGLEGCTPVPVAAEVSPDGLWRTTAASVARGFTPRTRAVILVSPNNPTGAYLDPARLSAVQRLCTERSCPLILDEVFHDYPAAGFSPPTAVDEPDGLTIRLSGLSKVVGAPQLKLGWMRLSGDPRQVRAAADRLEFIADAYLSASTPAQLAAERLLPECGPIQSRIRRRLEANQETACRTLGRGSPARLLPREGGWSLVLRLPAGVDDEDLAYRLLVEDHVLVQPGFYFDFPEGEYLVLSLLPPADQFDPGLQRLAARLAARGVSAG